MNELHNILLVNSSDGDGGAERVCRDLLRTYRSRGYGAHLVVGARRSSDEGVIPLPLEPVPGVTNHLAGALVRLLERAPFRTGVGALGVWLSAFGRGSLRARLRGFEDFDFAPTWRLLDLPPHRADVVHLHNLHSYGGFFDLRVLPSLSAQLPVFLTLHDAWLLSGHCAHSFECERWRTGCGRCPDLNIYPPVVRDETNANWLRKRSIFERSRLLVATPSAWLMEKVAASILAAGTVESRVIPNGVDTDTFKPAADRASLRRQLGLPADADILLFVAAGIRANIWKDYPMLEAAVAQLAMRPASRRIIFVGLGDAAPTRHVGSTVEMRFVPFEPERTNVAVVSGRRCLRPCRAGRHVS